MLNTNLKMGAYRHVAQRIFQKPLSCYASDKRQEITFLAANRIDQDKSGGSIKRNMKFTMFNENGMPIGPIDGPAELAIGEFVSMDVLVPSIEISAVMIYWLEQDISGQTPRGALFVGCPEFLGNPFDQIWIDFQVSDFDAQLFEYFEGGIGFQLPMAAS